MGRETRYRRITFSTGAISIHSLRGEGDKSQACRSCSGSLFQSTPSVGRETTVYRSLSIKYALFQSTPSVGRETIICQCFLCDAAISIHSLRGEGDPFQLQDGLSCLHFNPLPPWGGRLLKDIAFSSVTQISIHSLRGEGDEVMNKTLTDKGLISIHSLRGEGDGLNVYTNKKGVPHFNPLPPWGGRPTLDKGSDI